PPPLTSGIALASFVLALIGAFTVVGTLLAVLCGAVGLSHIRRAPAQVGGKRFAQAGMALGIIFTLATLAALWSAEFIRIDGLLRVVEWAGKVKYAPNDIVAIGRSDGLDPGRAASINRPSPAWGQLTFKASDQQNADDLVLVN